MKKFFTLIAMAAMAVGAQAQGTYAITEGTEFEAGTTISTVDNITLTFGVAGDAAFQAAKASAIEGTEFTAYTPGKGVNGSEDGGTQYVLKPVKNGHIMVGVVLNSGKKFFITEDGTPLSNYNAYTVDEKYTGTFEFDVKAGKTYKVYCTGSKLGFHGFVYSNVSDGGGEVQPSEEGPDSYKAIVVNADGSRSLAPEFAAVVGEDGVATNVVDGKSVVTVTTENVTMEAVGGATPANVSGGAQDIMPGAALPDYVDAKGEAHPYAYEIASVNSWADIKWENKQDKTDINDAAQTKLYTLVGSGNPYVKLLCEEIVTDDDHTGTYRALYEYYKPGMDMPQVGLYYKFTTKTDGDMKIQVWANKGNRNTYLINGQTKEAVPYKAEGYINGQKANYDTPAIDPETGEPKLDNQGNPVYEQYCIFFSADEIQEIHNTAKVNEEGVDTAPYVIAAGNQAFWGWITFEAKAGVDYWLFQDSSQVGFGGFKFTSSDPNAIRIMDAAPVQDGRMFNLQGQMVGNNYKGIVVKNGRKYIQK